MAVVLIQHTLVMFKDDLLAVWCFLLFVCILIPNRLWGIYSLDWYHFPLRVCGTITALLRAICTFYWEVDWVSW